MLFPGTGADGAVRMAEKLRRLIGRPCYIKGWDLTVTPSIVRDIAFDPESHSIFGHLISLAKSLGLQTFAEGVEDERQVHPLGEKGCQEAQGFCFSRPLPPDVFLEWTRERWCPAG